ncbi:hypothetical protein EYF80_049459 [Liparis tanakae]|uniref:Uncharacterized protein n=1 Tax=Liparis tanakae TaxID=230148 RepID=A0A4Z2FHI8_9TELE|nr:hypothetical protein EYF80_049459 [Liparis tanakae]
MNGPNPFARSPLMTGCNEGRRITPDSSGGEMGRNGRDSRNGGARVEPSGLCLAPSIHYESFVVGPSYNCLAAGKKATDSRSTSSTSSTTTSETVAAAGGYGTGSFVSQRAGPDITVFQKSRSRYSQQQESYSVRHVVSPDGLNVFFSSNVGLETGAFVAGDSRRVIMSGTEAAQLLSDGSPDHGGVGF